MNSKDLNYLYTIINEKPIQSDDIFNHKQYIKMQIHNLYDKFFPISNINSMYSKNDLYNYNYEYQRFDARLEYDNFIYNFYRVKNPSKIIYTNCGMSAIFSVLLALKLCNYNYISYEHDIYFETQKVISMLKFHKFKSIIFLDSISNNFSFNSNYNKKIVIVDTTCYHPSDFKNMINHLTSNGNVCILVRSHTKLDMLGLEYSSLGSIAFVFPKKVNTGNMKKFKNIIQKTVDICANIGLFATEYNIFPLLNDKTLISLNKKRIIRLNNNNVYFYEKIKDKRDIKLHNHKLFSTLQVNVKIDELKKEIIKFVSNSNSLCKFSPSFGFDYIALDTYIDLDSGKNTVRISIGDVERSIIDLFIKEFLNVKF